ncbi:MAG: prephenate dehydrogenase, partial [Verrucomicrobiota bacterium]
MKKLAIMGLGLMGGSIGLAAKKAGVAEVVAGYARREESRRLAMELGIVDKVYSGAAESVESADMAVFCVPVLAIPALAGDCKSGLSKGCIVTDVGSTKKQLETQMRSALEGTGAVFVGSHPIAGSEMTGLSAARADLFEGAMVVVTEGEGKEKTEAVVDMWSQFGARVCVMSSDRHDEILAKTSHLPHLLAAGLARHVLGAGDDDVQNFCGSGFN